jgi:hypothetical protein
MSVSQSLSLSHGWATHASSVSSQTGQSSSSMQSIAGHGAGTLSQA